MVSMNQVLKAWIEEMIKSEGEGKARCAVEWCNKLFKSSEFVRKHIRTKHTDLAAGRLMKAAEPFMKTRYESEELLYRPLPPLQCETATGVELKTVKDILERCKKLPRPNPGHARGGSYGGRGGGFRERGRGGGGMVYNSGRGGRGDRRWSAEGVMDRDGGFGRYNNNQYPQHQPPTGVAPGSSYDYARGAAPNRAQPPPSSAGYQQPTDPNNARRIMSYVDVDAPQVINDSLQNTMYVGQIIIL